MFLGVASIFSNKITPRNLDYFTLLLITSSLKEHKIKISSVFTRMNTSLFPKTHVTYILKH